MSFAVIAFASPPPDLVPDIVTDQSAFVVQENQTVTVYTFEVQEVAFANIGNLEISSCQDYASETIAKIELPGLIMNEYCFAEPGDILKPPASNTSKAGINITIDMQHSNYGYPLTGDNC